MLKISRKSTPFVSIQKKKKSDFWMTSTKINAFTKKLLFLIVLIKVIQMKRHSELCSVLQEEVRLSLETVSTTLSALERNPHTVQ